MSPPAQIRTPLARFLRRCRPWMLGVGWMALALLLESRQAPADDALAPQAAAENAIAPFLQAYCADCHDGDQAEAGLAFARLLEAPTPAHRRREWQRVIERLELGEMPPEGSASPSDQERGDALAWLRRELAAPDCSLPQHAGRVTLRRLNRTEYENTVRDLVGVDFAAAAIFPNDELAFGFDNNGDALALPPALLEKYLAAAEQIAAQAIVTPESITEPQQAFTGRQLRGGDRFDGEVLVRNTSGEVWTDVELPAPGEYLVRARVFASQAGTDLARMRMFAGEETMRVVEVAATRDDPQTLVAQFHAEAGKHRIGIAFENDFFDPQAADPLRRDRNLYVESLSVVGPTERLNPANLPIAHRRVAGARPATDAWLAGDGWIEGARRRLARFLLRAYRRPPTDAGIARLIELARGARSRGDSYERAMQLVLEATLVSPQFLFRGERDEPDDASRGDAATPPAPPQDKGRPAPRDLDDFELAARLSYFLWSSMPDDRLLRIAAEGKLQKRLDRQIDRMLADPRADELIRNFGEQWLETRNLQSMSRDAKAFPEFDDALPAAMREETFLLLRDVIRNDRPLPTLLTADYGFVNGRLARHYGLDAPTGAEFVRIPLPPERHAGILAQASVLALTSHDDRTSPVLRGKWVLNRLLADAPPPPPPGVSNLPEATGELSGATHRQRLEAHRADPSCAVCHVRMDPLGLALENFDALGRWREGDGDAKIDASGQLPDGRQFSGALGLRDILMADYPQIRRALTQQLLTYALGRGVEPIDDCALNEIEAAAAANDDTFSSMVRAVVHSTPFRQRD